MKLSYNNWMQYIYNNLYPKPVKKIVYKFGEIGNRSEKEIQDEIAYLKKIDTDISNKVRSTYTIKK